ncbi:MAG: leucyl/phenylalanyl-tRNA--protein transferase [Chloroflexota bacterium]
MTRDILMICRDWDHIDPRGAAPGYALVVGGSLRPEFLLDAYRRGYFPLPSPGNDQAEINRVLYQAEVEAGRTLVMETDQPLGPFATTWWNPETRPVVINGHLHVSRSLGQELRNRCTWTTTADEAFGQVVFECGRERRERWLTDELVDSLHVLHQSGWAHSIEVWDDEKLVGGLFGIGIGGVFSIDSTFHRASNAGKVTFADLQDRLADSSVSIIDLQWPQHYLSSIGAQVIEQSEYLSMLRQGAGPLTMAVGRKMARRLGKRRQSGAAMGGDLQ